MTTPPTHPLQENAFDPLALLQQQRDGDGDELRTTRLRMLWLRQRVPEAQVATTLVRLDERVVVMAASIALPDGGAGSGHAASVISNGGDPAGAIETAELGAIGRALDILGYVVSETSTPAQPDAPPEPPEGTQPPQDNDPQGAQPPGHVQAVRSLRDRARNQPASDDDTRKPDLPMQTTPPADATPTPLTRRPANTPPAETPPRSAPTAQDDPPLEDVSWTAFWEWARATWQLGSRRQLEELLGQSVAHKNPAQLRQMLIAHFGAQATGES